MNISNSIEEFINRMLGTDNELNISRNELAQYFDCAPSQINYVLSTRFTVDRGYVVDSRRGGGGYITLVRLSPTSADIIANIEESALSEGISHGRANQILALLCDQDLLTQNEARILSAALSDKALLTPVGNKEILRANILRSVLVELSR